MKDLEHISMDTPARGAVRRIAAGIIGLGLGMGAVAYLSGCSSDTGFSVRLLDIDAGHQGSMYREGDNRTPSDQALFERDAQPYNNSEVTNEGLTNSPLWQHYQNREE